MKYKLKNGGHIELRPADKDDTAVVELSILRSYGAIKHSIGFNDLKDLNALRNMAARYLVRRGFLKRQCGFFESEARDDLLNIQEAAHNLMVIGKKIAESEAGHTIVTGVGQDEESLQKSIEAIHKLLYKEWVDNGNNDTKRSRYYCELLPNNNQKFLQER